MKLKASVVTPKTAQILTKLAKRYNEWPQRFGNVVVTKFAAGWALDMSLDDFPGLWLLLEAETPEVRKECREFFLEALSKLASRKDEMSLALKQAFSILGSARG